MNPTPVYRTYLLSCPANAGKLETVAKWVGVWRELATLERDYQVERFRKTQGKHGLESTAGMSMRATVKRATSFSAGVVANVPMPT